MPVFLDLFFALRNQLTCCDESFIPEKIICTINNLINENHIYLWQIINAMKLSSLLVTENIVNQVTLALKEFDILRNAHFHFLAESEMKRYLMFVLLYRARGKRGLASLGIKTVRREKQVA